MADTHHVKDHVVREVVNRLRDTALQFHAHGSLRERLARELEPLLAASRPAEVDDEGLLPLPPEAAAWMLGRNLYQSYDVIPGNHLPPRGNPVQLYTAEQYRQGQRDAVAAYQARMPDPEEISDAITEAYNFAHSIKDWSAAKHWEELGNSFGRWAAPSHTTNKEK